MLTGEDRQKIYNDIGYRAIARMPPRGCADCGAVYFPPAPIWLLVLAAVICYPVTIALLVMTVWITVEVLTVYASELDLLTASLPFLAAICTFFFGLAAVKCTVEIIARLRAFQQERQ